MRPCKRCGAVVYCGRKCEKAHWKKHKKACKKKVAREAQVAAGATGGRGVVCVVGDCQSLNFNFRRQ